jgi:hypothetical protein
MKTVFGLSAGEIGVTTNEPENTVYVVQLAEYEKPIDDLRTDFAGERQQMYLAVARPDQMAIFRAWVADLEKEAGIRWHRQADIARRSREADEPMNGEEL